LYTYKESDELGRLTKVSTALYDDPSAAFKEAEYTYYAAGTTKDLKLGNNIQQVDYRYNTRDWLTRINDMDNLGSDRFAQRLYYNESNPLGASARFNGNIAATVWWNTGVGTDPRMGYRFTYDNAHRLTGSAAYRYTTSWLSTTKWGEPSITYDGNGNIQTVQRRGHNGNMMDNLTYNYYANSNRLSYITDVVSAGVDSV
jgi:hypothetical protein